MSTAEPAAVSIASGLDSLQEIDLSIQSDQNRSQGSPIESSEETTSVEGYFDADGISGEEAEGRKEDKAQGSSTKDEPPSLVSPPLLSPTIAQVLGSGTTPDRASQVSFRRLTPGWNMKGWLRTASSSALTSREQTSKTRTGESGILPTSVMVSSSVSLEHALSALSKASEEDNESGNNDIDWPYFKRLLAMDSPQESSELRVSMQAGIPNALRGLVWQRLTNSKNPELEKVYTELLSERSEFDRLIKKDVQRLNRSWIKVLEDMRI